MCAFGFLRCLQAKLSNHIPAACSSAEMGSLGASMHDLLHWGFVLQNYQNGAAITTHSPASILQHCQA